MPGPLEGELSLIVLEQQARWPACANQYQTSLPNSLVEAQGEGEQPGEFVARVGRRIASVASKGSRPRVAIIAANTLLDPVTLAGRRGLCQAAVRAMGLSGELVLTASPNDASGDDGEVDRVRHELFALAGALCDELVGTEITVSVRFPQTMVQPQSHDRSGLRPSIHKVVADNDHIASG